MKRKTNAGPKPRSAARAFHRILDANCNRAKEALRVCEDISRFLMNHARLAADYKKMRHGLTRALLDFPASYGDMLAARDPSHDVGKGQGIQDTAKPKWRDLMTANQKRAQEALRVLEEISKAIHPRAADEFQKLRFRLYELEKKGVRGF